MEAELNDDDESQTEHDDVNIFNSIYDIRNTSLDNDAETSLNTTTPDLYTGIQAIFSVNKFMPKYRGNHFVGACINSGAQRTMNEAPQATAYSFLAGIQLIKTWKHDYALDLEIILTKDSVLWKHAFPFSPTSSLPPLLMS